MSPFKTRASRALLSPIHRLAALTTLALAIILICAHTAAAAVAPATAAGDQLQQASGTPLPPTGADMPQP